MGFFSQDCRGCGHPMLSTMATEAINAWMNDVVVITPKNNLHMGEYDGYGNVGGADMAVGDDNEVWHRACWEVAGRPMVFTAKSPFSADQGWFFDSPTHEIADPRINETVGADGEQLGAKP